LILQNSKVILVDNSNDPLLREIDDCNINLIQLEDNLGIARAQNVGIKFALGQNAEIFVFFDQDSVIDDFFLYKLIEPLDLVTPLVTSPIFFDKENGFRFPSYSLSKFGLLKKVFNDKFDFYVDVIISSGSATNRRSIELVGLMNEDYFIDFVDTEWSLRCKAKRIPIRVVNSARMLHSIGDKSIDLRIIRLFVHSPVRTYYKIRNSFLFFRNKNVPLLLGIREIISALVHNLIIIFFVEKKRLYIRNYFVAIFDGIIGKVGKKQLDNEY
jgi:rhamnosyltransferase